MESVAGQGSTFWVELPLVAGLQPQPQPGPAEIIGAVPFVTAHSHTMLYIEDNLSNIVLVERILIQRPGVRLLSAMQGGLGLDLAREHRPDLILLDLHLPDRPGQEILQELQTDVRTRGIPIIVLSADATPVMISSLLGAGVRSYLTKPFDVLQFLAVLDELLAGRLAG